MTHLGARPRQAIPSEYKGFRVELCGGRVYAIPPFLDAEELLEQGAHTTHPAVLSATSVEGLVGLIDQFDESSFQQDLVDKHKHHLIFRYQGGFYAIPEIAGPLNLSTPENRHRVGALRADSLGEIRSAIDQALVASPVEHAGWLPIFKHAGNCGKHPQFAHVSESPEGYRFTVSAPPERKKSSPWAEFRRRAGAKLRQGALAGWLVVRPLLGWIGRGPRGSLGARFRTLGALLKILWTLLGTANILAVLRFVRSRNFESQLLITDKHELVLFTSMPYTYGQSPWMVEIEDVITLFHPHIKNGWTSDLNITDSPYRHLVGKLLHSERCRGVITHMKSTAEMIPKLFDSEELKQKVFHVPLGVRLAERYQSHEESEEIHLLFINSWSQGLESFFLRGGLDVLEAFATLKQRYPQLRLTLRTELPYLDPYYHRILEQGWARVIPRFMTRREMDDLLAESHIVLIPSARVHIVSLLQAMSAGLAVVASDGWGFEEYLDHERNGLIVPGRYGKVSWVDEGVGLLREDYEPMHLPDPQVVDGIIESVSRLVEDRLLRQRLGQNARSDVEQKYNLDQWNQGLREAFDSAMGMKIDDGMVVGPNLPTPDHFPPFADQREESTVARSRIEVP